MKHSVILQYDRCRGCTTCIKSCPTEAIRVRSGKAAILNARCIDCGTCIQVCPHKAIRSTSDPLDLLSKFKYNVALPEPALYGQFQNMDDIDIILNGLLEIGFQDVYEVAKAAELLSDYQRQCITNGSQRVMPQITSACPTVLRLIRMRFPKLIPNIAPVITPVELAAILARREAAEKTGLKPEEIGIFSIVPCSSQVTAAHNPDTLEKPVLDGAFAIRDLYLKLLSPMKKLRDKPLKPLSSAGIVGVGWAYCGGESAARMGERYVAVDGIQNVIRMLEEIEDGRLPEADFIELTACVQGCVGGCLTVENPYAARMRIKKLMKGLPVSCNRFTLQGEDRDIVKFDRELQYVPVFVLDEDRSAAMEKLQKIEALEKTLPGLHCGSCGAPSCHAFAEDVVLGRADRSDCIFQMRERMQYMSGEDDPDEYLPAPFRKRKD
ncbi:MAG: [Fe-Fe] hydrogenase large subunit C-terminal domain-containing protein, partial [Pseudoflavonifractor sp.]